MRRPFQQQNNIFNALNDIWWILGIAEFIQIRRSGHCPLLFRLRIHRNTFQSLPAQHLIRLRTNRNRKDFDLHQIVFVLLFRQNCWQIRRNLCNMHILTVNDRLFPSNAFRSHSILVQRRNFSSCNAKGYASSRVGAEKFRMFPNLNFAMDERPISSVPLTKLLRVNCWRRLVNMKTRVGT